MSRPHEIPENELIRYIEMMMPLGFTAKALSIELGFSADYIKTRAQRSEAVKDAIIKSRLAHTSAVMKTFNQVLLDPGHEKWSMTVAERVASRYMADEEPRESGGSDGSVDVEAAADKVIGDLGEKR
ncbi:MAG: hypothetical protein B6D63_06530 [Candidatus Latescibacteria bacterium 4484_7]|nr:MAG: hypothetical protein B6D63_06530 [Candidatus Latescibacteria bacterium 4484_7]